MTQVQPFSFGTRQLRTLTDEHGEPLFVAKDAAVMLGYSEPRRAIDQHCRGGAFYTPIVDRLGRTQQARVIREPDLWRLIAGSHLPEAKRIEAWIFEEVLPSIRRTGSYTHQKGIAKYDPLAERESLDSLRAIIREELSLGISRRTWGSPLTEAEIATIKRLSKQGWSISMIAREIGCSEKAVADRRRK